MRPFIVAALWAADLVGSFISGLIGLTDWSLFGWAFCGSTLFVVFEATKEPPKVRPHWQWPLLIFVGMVVSLGCNTWVSEKIGIPIVPVTIGLGVLGYYYVGKLIKNADNPTAMLGKSAPTQPPTEKTPDGPGPSA